MASKTPPGSASGKTPKADDSLDFSHLGDGRAVDASTAAPAAKPGLPRARKPTTRRAPQQAKPRRSVAIPLLIAAAVAVAIAFFVMQRTEELPETQPKVKTPPPPFQPPAGQAVPSAPMSKPQIAAPPPPTKAPPAGPPPLPAEFMKELKAYSAITGAKALALALDPDGRYAFASVAGVSSQKTANDEALSDCGRYRAQSGIRTACRLYAEGEKIVW